MASVTFDKASRLYQGADRPAVDELELDIQDGEFLVLVGPSGCGKSTVCGCWPGWRRSTSGSIRIGERDVTNLSPKDRDIAMVFQNYALYPHMTVAENMGFALKIAGVSKDEDGRSGSGRRRRSWIWSRTWSASRRRCPVVSGSGWRWAGRSCASRRCS